MRRSLEWLPAHIDVLSSKYFGFEVGVFFHKSNSKVCNLFAVLVLDDVGYDTANGCLLRKTQSNAGKVTEVFGRHLKKNFCPCFSIAF